MASIGQLCGDGCGNLAAVRLAYPAGDTPDPVVCLTCSTDRERGGDVFTRHWLNDDADARSIPIEPPPAQPEQTAQPPSSEAG